MKLLLLLSLFAVAFANGAYIQTNEPEVNDASQQVATVLQVQPNEEDSNVEKKLGKRSLLLGHGLSLGELSIGHGWPLYSGLSHGLSSGLGSGWYGGWYPSLPLIYSSGWYGDSGWHKKW